MFSFPFRALFSLFLLGLAFTATLSAQTAMIDEIVQEPADDGVPVIVKHLPDWEKVQKKAVYASSKETYPQVVGNDPIALSISFNEGMEAASADYGPGKLAIVEFNTPQAAADGDALIQAKLAETAERTDRTTIYRRVGNYAVFVFDTKDAAAANALIDQVKFEKSVQWMSEDPNVALARKERDYVRTTSEVVLNAMQITGYIILFTAGVGGLAGFLVFRSRNRQRLMADSYTDAGGMVRLNLDDFASASSTDRLLNSK